MIPVLVLSSHERSTLTSAPSRHVIVRQPLEAVPLTNDKEARFFCIFREQTSHELAGAFHLSLWDRLVLQASRDEPFARHAVVALGALSMSYKARSPHKGIVSKYGEEHHSFALIQYDKAVKCMRTTISDPNHDLWKALLACILVYCFESFQGRKDLAISHALSGQKLFQDEIMSRSISKNRGCILDSDIIQAYSRLDLLLMTAFDTRSPQLHDTFSYDSFTMLSQMPAAFMTVAMAKTYLDLLMRKIGHFLASALGFQDPADAYENCPEDPQETETKLRFGLSIYCYQGRVIPPAFRGQHAEYTRALDRWFASFECFARDEDVRNEISDDWLAMARLQIHSRLLKVLLVAATFTSEMTYDDYLHDYRAIVTYALPIVEHEAKLSEPSFNFDLSIAAPLGFVAMHCRDWVIRRDALHLLKMKTLRKEVFWERGMLEGQARFLMETEEEGLGFGEVIPRECRTRMLRVRKDETRNFATVTVAKGQSCYGRGDDTRTRVISW